MTAASPSTPLRVALAGLGTVGAGVLALLQRNLPLIARRAGRPIIVTAVSARDRQRDRGVAIADLAWEDDATALASRPDVDAVVELIGGADGPALTLARAAMAAAKPFVTANKAMMAHHGLELATAAEQAGVPLKFEAAVAGGIPIIKGLREGAAANSIAAVHGILNGTCNYILSRMERDALEFSDVLADAQALGFAEADPSFDIDGVDAAHKLAILSAIAFGSKPDFAAVAIHGIRPVRLVDIHQAAALGYRIRLVGHAEQAAAKLLQRVQPVLVPLAHPLAAVKGPLNAVVAEADHAGRLIFMGAGAGAGPTASAVVADLMDVARGERGPAFAMPVAQLVAMAPADPSERQARHYLRLRVADRPGVLAEVAALLRDSGVSIERLNQPAPDADGSVHLMIVTHLVAEWAAGAAPGARGGRRAVLAPPLIMPIMEEEQFA